MEENFSDNIKDVIGFSRDEALRLSNNSIGTEHFILGIIRLKNAGAVDILSALGIKLEDLRKDVEMFATNKTNNQHEHDERKHTHAIDEIRSDNKENRNNHNTQNRRRPHKDKQTR